MIPSALRQLNALGCRAIRKVTLGIVVAGILCVVCVIQLCVVEVQQRWATVNTGSGVVMQPPARLSADVSESLTKDTETAPTISAQDTDVTDSSTQEEAQAVPSNTVDPIALVPKRGVIKHPEQYHKDKIVKLNSWTEEMSAEEREIFKDRRKKVEEVCSSLKLEGVLTPKLQKVYSNMLFVNKYNMIWCPIFKSASTTWVKNLLLLAGVTRVNSGLHNRARKIYPQPKDPAALQDRLKKDMKMMIVRHPLERLLSAYRDKMLRIRRPNDRFENMQKSIASKYGDRNKKDGAHDYDLSTAIPVNANTTTVNTTHPTFTQFLKKVKDDLKKAWASGAKININMHWRPYWITCAPCHITYDLIAHVETLDKDQEFIIRELGLHDLLLNLHTHASNFDVYNGTSEATTHYFSQVPLSLLKDIVTYYQYDFSLYGYSPDPYFKIAKKNKKRGH